MAFGHNMIKDMRIKFPSAGSPSVAFTTSNDASWNVDGTDVFNPRCFDLDLSGLAYEGIEDTRVRVSTINNDNPVIPGLSGGSIKFKTYMGTGSASTTLPFETKLLGQFLGTTYSPNAKTYSAVNASSDANTVQVASNGETKGCAILVGTRGDARGNGEVRRAFSISGGTGFELEMDLPGTVNDSDAIVVGHHACFSDTVAVDGVDILIVLHSGQVLNLLSCAGSISFSGFGIGEIPTIEYDLQVSAWRWETTKDTFTASAYSGGSPVPERMFGGFWMTDSTSSTRTAIKCANVAFDIGLELSPIVDLNGINGNSGQFAKVAYTPKISFDILCNGTQEDLPGLQADFEAGTQKQVIVQVGYQAQKCAAVIGYAYLTKAPVYTEVNGLEAISVEMAFGSKDITTNYVDPSFYLF